MGDETGAEGGGFGAADEDDETADGRRADVLLSYTALLGRGDGKGRIVCRLGERGCFFLVAYLVMLCMVRISYSAGSTPELCAAWLTTSTR